MKNKLPIFRSRFAVTTVQSFLVSTVLNVTFLEWYVWTLQANYKIKVAPNTFALARMECFHQRLHLSLIHISLSSLGIYSILAVELKNKLDIQGQKMCIRDSNSVGEVETSVASGNPKVPYIIDSSSCHCQLVRYRRN